MKRVVALIPVVSAVACQCDRYRCRHSATVPSLDTPRPLVPPLFRKEDAEYVYALEEMPSQGMIEQGPTDSRLPSLRFCWERDLCQLGACKPTEPTHLEARSEDVVIRSATAQLPTRRLQVLLLV